MPDIELSPEFAEAVTSGKTETRKRPPRPIKAEVADGLDRLDSMAECVARQYRLDLQIDVCKPGGFNFAWYEDANVRVGGHCPIEDREAARLMAEAMLVRAFPIACDRAVVCPGCGEYADPSELTDEHDGYCKICDEEHRCEECLGLYEHCICDRE